MENQNNSHLNILSKHHTTSVFSHKSDTMNIEETEGELDSKDWAEAFSWITIKVICNSCGETNNEWISYETM